jgi:hypothetical protein
MGVIGRSGLNRWWVDDGEYHEVCSGRRNDFKEISLLDDAVTVRAHFDVFIFPIRQSARTQTLQMLMSLNS